MEEYRQLTIDDWMSMKESLKRDLVGVQESFVRIGYKLRQIRDQRLYENDGYKSIAEFAKAEYNLGASTVSRFIEINEKYSIGGNSEQLRPEFALIGSSKLSEMLSLPDSDLQMIQPETRKVDIRELKAFNREEPEPAVADDIDQVIEKFFEENKEALRELFETAAIYAESKAKEIINPAGNKVFRKGMYFLMMYEADIKIKKFGGTPETMSWAEFLERTERIFAERWQQYGEDSGDIDAGGAETGAGSAGDAEREGAKTDDGPREEERQGTGEDAGERTTAEPERETIAPAQKETREDVAQECVQNSAESAQVPEENAQEVEKNVPEYEKMPEVGQKSTETTETAEEQEIPKTEPHSKLGQTIGNIEREAFETAMNPPEVIEKPFGTRKDYIDELTAYGMAEYLAKEYQEHRLKASSLAFPSELEAWLNEEVDTNGNPLED